MDRPSPSEGPSDADQARHSEAADSPLGEPTKQKKASDPSLVRRVFGAGIWSLLFHGLTRGIGFIRNIALARILSPDDIGLFGITLAILSIIDRFSQTGLNAALIQRKESIRSYLDAAWTLQATRGVGLAALLFFGAPYIAAFFEEPRSVGLIQLLAFSMLLRGFQNIGIVEFARDLELRYQYLHRFSSRFIDLLVSIVLALILENAWALMLGLVAGRAAALIVSFVVHPYRPRIRFDFAQTNELGKYGRWVFLNNIVYFLAYRGDNFIIAKLLGAPALGIYTLAYSISEVMAVEVSRVLNEAAFPAYARVQDDLARARRGFFVATELVAAASFPAAAVLALLSLPLVQIVLGDGWTEVALVLPALSVAGAIRGLNRNCGSVSRGLGRPEQVFAQNVLAVIVTYTMIFVLLPRFALQGVAFSVLAGQLCVLPVAMFAAARLLGAGMREIISPLIPASVLTGGTILTVVVLRQAGLTGSHWTTILVLACCGVVYLALSAGLWQANKTGPLRLLALSREKTKKSGRRNRRRKEAYSA